VLPLNAVGVLRLLSKCDAAIEVSRLLSRCEAAVKVLRLLSRFRGRRQGVEAAVKVLRLLSRPPSRCSRPLSRCRGCRGVKAAVDVEDTILEINATVEVLCEPLLIS
jgi:hypothetical protein